MPDRRAGLIAERIARLGEEGVFAQPDQQRKFVREPDVVLHKDGGIPEHGVRRLRAVVGGREEEFAIGPAVAGPVRVGIIRRVAEHAVGARDVVLEEVFVVVVGVAQPVFPADRATGDELMRLPEQLELAVPLGAIFRRPLRRILRVLEGVVPLAIDVLDERAVDELARIAELERRGELAAHDACVGIITRRQQRGVAGDFDQRSSVDRARDGTGRVVVAEVGNVAGVVEPVIDQRLRRTIDAEKLGRGLPHVLGVGLQGQIVGDFANPRDKQVLAVIPPPVAAEKGVVLLAFVAHAPGRFAVGGRRCRVDLPRGVEPRSALGHPGADARGHRRLGGKLRRLGHVVHVAAGEKAGAVDGRAGAAHDVHRLDVVKGGRVAEVVITDPLAIDERLGQIAADIRDGGLAVAGRRVAAGRVGDKLGHAIDPAFAQERLRDRRDRTRRLQNRTAIAKHALHRTHERVDGVLDRYVGDDKAVEREDFLVGWDGWAGFRTEPDGREAERCGEEWDSCRELHHLCDARPKSDSRSERRDAPSAATVSFAGIIRFRFQGSNGRSHRNLSLPRKAPLQARRRLKGLRSPQASTLLRHARQLHPYKSHGPPLSRRPI